MSTASSLSLPAPRSLRTAGARPLPQLGRRAIAGVWAAAALPMAALSWIGAPLLADRLSGASAMPRALILSLTAGLIWQFVLVGLLVAREQGTLRWDVVREALWLRSPASPRSGRRGGRVWLVLPVLIVAFAAKEFVPGLPYPAGRDMGTFLGTDAGQTFLAGSWDWFAILVVLAIFNTVLGEELLFRGYLLPRMEGAFGRWDWVANGVLFAGYHLHVPWKIPVILLDMFALGYPTKRYRSALMGIVVHSVESIVILGLVLALVLAG